MSTDAREPAVTLAALVRGERTRLVATLVRRHGFDVAEEAVDAAVEAALLQWPTEGTPNSPRAWLLSVAKRRAIDRVRKDTSLGAIEPTLRALADPTDDADLDAATFPDDRLRLLFTCCHPALARDAQVALALRWLSGLSTEDVARAFCLSAPTMAQRLSRAKAKIETAGIPYQVPERAELPERLDAVLEVIYAIFNEGYVATRGTELSRVDLAEEALRLAELVVSLQQERAEPKAMLALLWLIHARRDAREVHGELVSLEDQDRSHWDRGMIARGKQLLALVLEQARPSTYAIEAAIQALHDEAPSFEDTDFRQIATLYALLGERTDSPLVAVNEAVARAMFAPVEASLERLAALEHEGSLQNHPALPAARADLLRRLGKNDEARVAYDAAIAVTQNQAEQRSLRRRRAALP